MTSEKDLQDFLQKQPEQSDEYYQDLHRGKNLAKNYAAYRPTYPPALYDRIIAYHDQSQNSGRQLAVDVCCGTGQATVPLTKFFTKVIGVDVSEDQIDLMPTDIANLTSYVCPAEELTMIESGSVDLVTIASGLHWVDIPKFLLEAKRILKPGGSFAAYTWLSDCLTNQKANEYFREILFTTYKNYLSSKVLMVLDKYQSIEFPFTDLKRFEGDLTDQITVEQFKGYMHSWHTTKLYYQDHPGTDIVEDSGKRIEAILKMELADDQAEVAILLRRNYLLILGRNN